MTAPPAAGPRTANVIQCLDEPIPSVRVEWDGRPTSGPMFTTLAGDPYDLYWPRGFSARIHAGRLELVDPGGSVIARDSELIDDLGGTTQNIVCRVGQFVYGPAF